MPIREGIYAILDPDALAVRDPLAFADAVLGGGIVALQLRAKHDRDRELLALGRALAARARAAGVPFVMNDRADLARLVLADALHLGQEDLPLADARLLVGAMPIGLSTHGLDQARAAVSAGAAMIGFGPVYDTASKANPDPTVGTRALAEVVRATSVPVIAIGGITHERVAEVSATGAHAVAVISSLTRAEDPRRAALGLREAFFRHRP